VKRKNKAFIVGVTTYMKLYRTYSDSGKIKLIDISEKRVFDFYTQKVPFCLTRHILWACPICSTNIKYMQLFRSDIFEEFDKYNDARVLFSTAAFTKYSFDVHDDTCV